MLPRVRAEAVVELEGEHGALERPQVERGPRRAELLALGAPLAREHLRVARDAQEEALAHAVGLLARAEDDQVRAQRQELHALEARARAEDLVVDAQLRARGHVQAHEEAAHARRAIARLAVGRPQRPREERRRVRHDQRSVFEGLRQWSWTHVGD